MSLQLYAARAGYVVLGYGMKQASHYLDGKIQEKANQYSTDHPDSSVGIWVKAASPYISAGLGLLGFWFGASQIQKHSQPKPVETVDWRGIKVVKGQNVKPLDDQLNAPVLTLKEHAVAFMNGIRNAIGDNPDEQAANLDRFNGNLIDGLAVNIIGDDANKSVTARFPLAAPPVAPVADGE